MRVKPRIRAIFAMLEPMAFPIANSPAPDREAVIATRISGADVPKETMVRPTIMGDMPIFLAIDAAPATNRSALQIRTIKPTRINAVANSIGTKFLLQYAPPPITELKCRVGCPMNVPAYDGK